MCDHALALLIYFSDCKTRLTAKGALTAFWAARPMELIEFAANS